jgi:cytochrome c1
VRLKCKQCGESKPRDEFAKAGYYRGRQTYRPTCKQCYAGKVRQVRHDNHVVGELSPHPKDIVKLPVLGWGYAGVIR